MKLTIELPDWADEKPIHVFVGFEHLAYKPARKGKVVQKKVRCNSCGKCCMDLSNTFTFPTINGTCSHLTKVRGKEEYTCGLGILRPFGCSMTEPTKDYCCIEQEERDLEGNLL